jgi:hypothetical protein
LSKDLPVAVWKIYCISSVSLQRLLVGICAYCELIMKFTSYYFDVFSDTSRDPTMREEDSK